MLKQRRDGFLGEAAVRVLLYGLGCTPPENRVKLRLGYEAGPNIGSWGWED